MVIGRVARIEPIARTGHYDHAVIRDAFEMRIHGAGEAEEQEGKARAAA